MNGQHTFSKSFQPVHRRCLPPPWLLAWLQCRSYVDVLSLRIGFFFFSTQRPDAEATPSSTGSTS